MSLLFILKRFWQLSFELFPVYVEDSLELKAMAAGVRVDFALALDYQAHGNGLYPAGGKPGLHFSYERHLQNRLREEFDFFGTPLRIVERHKKRGKR